MISQTTKKWLWFSFQLVLISGTFFGLGLIYQHYWPKLKVMTLTKVRQQSATRLPIRIDPQDLEIRFFPLRLAFTETQIYPTTELKSELAPISIEAIEIEPSFWSLLKGQLRIKDVRLVSPKLTYIKKNQLRQESSAPFPDINLDLVFNLPIERIEVTDLSVILRLSDLGTDVKIEHGHFSVENFYRSILIEIDLPEFQSKEKGRDRSVKMELALRTLLTKDEVKLSYLKLSRDQTYLVASGELSGNLGKEEITSASLNLKTHLELEEISQTTKMLWPKIPIPELQGSVDLEGRVNQLIKETPALAFKLSTENVHIAKRVLGRIVASGVLDQKSAKFKDFLIQNVSGAATVSNFEVGLSSPYPVKGTLEVKTLEIQKFLQDIQVGLIPVSVNISGKLPCLGQVFPTQIACTGDAKVHHLLVQPSLNSKKRIVELSELSANGRVDITSQQVNYLAEVTLGKASRGRSHGEIKFASGFDIHYSADNFDFSDVTSLADLKIEGNGRIEGTTKGNSQAATLELDAEMNNLWLEDFGLGSIKTNASYKAGHLVFNNTRGQQSGSRYQADVDVDLSNERIVVLAESSFMELEELQKLLVRRLPIPVHLAGSGQFRGRVEGPFQVNALSFTSNGNFQRVSIGKEDFDSFDFDISSVNGLIQANRAELRHPSGVIQVKGQLNPKFEADVVILGRALRMEQSNYLTSMGLNIDGEADFTMSLKGPLQDIRTELFGRLSKVVIGDRPAEDSSFQILFTKDVIEGKGQIFGDSLVGEMIFPLTPQAPLKVKARTKEFDLTKLFSFFSTMSRNRDFQTSLTSVIDLSAPSGGFWQSSGEISVDKFQIVRGPINLRLNESVTSRIKQGHISGVPWVLSGGPNTLKIDLDGTSEEKMDIQINGKFELGLLAFLTPIISSLRGELGLGVSISGPAHRPLLGGSAFINRASVTLEDFREPIDNLRADLLFTDRSILLNSIHGNIGGGEIVADGRIQVDEKSEVLADVSGQFKDIKLKNPAGVKSSGSGTISFKGKGEPSSLLPSFIKAENKSPLLLDLDIEASNPVSIKNELLDATAKGRLRLKGAPSTLMATGNITTLPGGKLIFRDTLFDIITGSVDYQNQLLTTPKIYVSAQALVSENRTAKFDSNSKVEYDVNLLIQGKVPDFKIGLTSQPVLSEPEIISLLALGMTSAGLQESTATGGSTTSSGIQIGASLLQKPLGKELKNKTGLELQISSETEENVSSPKFTLKKQLSPKVSASASRTIEDRPKQNVKLEYQLDKNFSTIGSWERQEQKLDSTTDSSSVGNKLGIDLEYRVNFK